MNLNICYLYYDLLNLYGENGNIKALIYHLKEQKIDINIDYISINDKKNFSKYDFIYIGSGTYNNLIIALNDLIKYKKDLNKCLENNTLILATGNALELFGDYIINDDKKINCLSLINFYTKYNKTRTVKDVNYPNNFIDKNIIGFENHYGQTIGINSNFIEKNNFIGTYVIGPILARNPEFCKYIIKKLINNVDPKFKLKKANYNFEELAYIENIKDY